jgi:hypothetical protein
MSKNNKISVFIVFLVLVVLAVVFLKFPIFTLTSGNEKQSDIIAGLVIQFREGTTELEVESVLNNYSLPTYDLEYNIDNIPGYYIIIDQNKTDDLREELRNEKNWTDPSFPDIHKGNYYVITVTEQAIQDKNFLAILEKNNIQLKKFVWCHIQFGERPAVGISKERANELKNKLEMNEKVLLVQFETIFS